MSKSRIEWTEATWNPSVGCYPISAGCYHCYARGMANRLQRMGAKGYENGFSFTMLPERLEYPYTVKKPTLFFVGSMSDLFFEDMKFDFLDKIFDTIGQTPQHTYQILTKRAARMARYFATRAVPGNVWLGVTVEDATEKTRIGQLNKISAPIKFLSIEPLLGALGRLNLEYINWVIVGGETGAEARRMEKDWVLDIKRQADAKEIPFFFKQWGMYGEDGVKRSKKRNGCLIDGEEYKNFPYFNTEPT